MKNTYGCYVKNAYRNRKFFDPIYLKNYTTLFRILMHMHEYRCIKLKYASLMCNDKVQ